MVSTLIGSGSDPIDAIRNKRGSRQSLSFASVSASGDAEVEAAPRPPTQSASTQTFTAAETTTVFEVAPEQPAKREVITYSKGVQTSKSEDGDSQSERSGKEEDGEVQIRKKQEDERRQEEIRVKLRQEIEEELRLAASSKLADEGVDGPQRFPLRNLQPEEINAVTSSNDFLSFVERSSKVIERALDDEYDLLTDYTVSRAREDGDSDDENFQYPRASRKSHSLRQTQHFWDASLSPRRQITDLQFSPHFSELFLTSLNQNKAAVNEPAGLVVLWNVHAPSRPEYVLHNQGSDVLAARFSPFHPNLIIGGCYTGQICLWDTRTSPRQSGAPMLKTPQSGSYAGHNHPVYSVNVAGTPNAHNILTASTDGVVCSWNIDMLTQPQEYLELSNPNQLPSSDLAPTCMSFPSSDPTFFVVGTEQGAIHPCHRYDRAGAKAGVDPYLKFTGHDAPVMSANFHPGRGPVDLGDLLLTSSVDWSVRLWRVRAGGATGNAAKSTTATAVGGTPSSDCEPLLSISREDLVFDAQWAPHRPSVFACVTGAGELEIFDLVADTEVPVARASPAKGKGGQSAILTDALNKVAWEKRKGGLIATAGLNGVISLFEVGKGLAGEGGVEEWQNMKKVVARAESKQL